MPARTARGSESAHWIELPAEPAGERPGAFGRQLLGRTRDLAALLCDRLELAPGMRGGKLHELGNRLRLERILGIFEDRVEIGLRGREDLELVFSETLRRLGGTFLETVGGFASTLAGPRYSLAGGVACSSLSRFAVVHGASSLADELFSYRSARSMLPPIELQHH